MSKNFELLSQVHTNRRLFGEAHPKTEHIIVDLPELKSGKSVQQAAMGAADFGLGKLTGKEVDRLAQRIFLSSQDNALHAVMFCGIEHGDGTSWISAQVARTVAAQGIGTICAIDTNFRSPTLHTYFDIRNDRGLADALRDTHPIRDFLQIGNVPNLHVLSAGTDANASLRLVPGGLRDRISELRADFDWLIFDVPPIAHSGDAVVLGRMVDGAVIVVSAHSTRRATARLAKESLEIAQVRLLGTVLNNRRFPIPESLYRRL